MFGKKKKVKENPPVLLDLKGTSNSVWDDPWDKDSMADFMDRFAEATPQYTISKNVDPVAEDHTVLNPVPENIPTEQITTEIEPSLTQGKSSDGKTDTEPIKQLTWEETLALFRQKNQPITEDILIKWTSKALENGWKAEDEIPDIHKISFSYDGELLLVTAYSFTEATKAVKEFNYTGKWQRVAPISEERVGIIQRLDSVNIYNRSENTFSPELINFLFEYSGNEALKNTALKSGTIGNEFALLVKDVQRKLYQTNDPKIVTGMLTPANKEYLYIALRQNRFEKLGIPPGKLGTIDLITKYPNLYESYSSSPLFNSKREGLDDLPEIIKLVAENPPLKTKYDLRIAYYHNSKLLEKSMTPEEIDLNYFMGYDKINDDAIAPEKNKIYQLLIKNNKNNFYLFRFIYYLSRTPEYTNVLEKRKITNVADFYKSLEIYENHYTILRDSYTEPYKKFVDDSINKNEAILHKELARYGIDMTGKRVQNSNYQSFINDLKIYKPKVDRIFQLGEAQQKLLETDFEANVTVSDPKAYNLYLQEEQQLKKELLGPLTKLSIKYPILKSKELWFKQSGDDKAEPQIGSSFYSLISNCNDSAKTTKSIYFYYQERQDEIDTLREKLRNDPQRYWKLEKALQQFDKEFNPSGNQTLYWSTRHIKDHESQELNDDWMGIISLALGILTIAVPILAVVTIPYAVTVGIHDVIEQYDQYKFESSASGGALGDENALSLVQPTMGYLLLSTAGLILDLAEIGAIMRPILKSFKLLKITTEGLVEILPDGIRGFKEVVREQVEKQIRQKLIAQKKSFTDDFVKAETDKIISKLTDENTIKDYTQKFIKARANHMSAEDFFALHGLPGSKTVPKGNKININEITGAKRIAELDSEAVALNKKLKEVWNKKYDNLVKPQPGMVYSVPFPITPGMINDMYKLGRKTFDLLSVGGQLAFTKFRAYIIKHLSDLDLTDPRTEKLIQRMYDDIKEGKEVDADAILKDLEFNTTDVVKNKWENISSADLLDEIIEHGSPDRIIGNYSIDLISKKIDEKYIINGFNINLVGDAKESISGIKEVLSTLEKEAIESGANIFVFRLHAIRNPGFLSERLWNLIGYSFINEGGAIIRVEKIIK